MFCAGTFTFPPTINHESIESSSQSTAYPFSLLSLSTGYVCSFLLPIYLSLHLHRLLYLEMARKARVLSARVPNHSSLFTSLLLLLLLLLQILLFRADEKPKLTSTRHCCLLFPQRMSVRYTSADEDSGRAWKIQHVSLRSTGFSSRRWRKKK